MLKRHLSSIELCVYFMDALGTRTNIICHPTGYHREGVSHVCALVDQQMLRPEVLQPVAARGNCVIVSQRLFSGYFQMDSRKNSTQSDSEFKPEENGSSSPSLSQEVRKRIRTKLLVLCHRPFYITFQL
jgi:hypothetical protein